VTIAGNSANIDGVASGSGGGVYADAGVNVHMANSILADNDRGFLVITDDDCLGEIMSENYNLLETAAGCILSGVTYANISGDPLLADLADNGGPTLTQRLLPGSPAIDAGNHNDCTTPGSAIISADQRGQPRHQDGDDDGNVRCDMGAYEAAYFYVRLPVVVRGP
jgi:hypothetical protein